MRITRQELEEKRDRSTSLRFHKHNIEEKFGTTSLEAQQAQRDYDESLTEAEAAIIQWISQDCKEGVPE